MVRDPYYQRDLALVHHLGFGFHADACAPGILDLLTPVLDRDGIVLELGCGSGLLTRYLIEAGHRVVATDASPAMLDLAREYAPGAASYETLRLPDDPLPDADAIVSIGHAISYLDTEEEVHQALRQITDATRSGGLFALDICDLEWGAARDDQPNYSDVGDDWAIVTRFSLPSPDKFVRDITTFVRTEDGSWRRSDERHENVLVDTARIPGSLRQHAVSVTVEPSFGSEELPVGLKVVIGRKPA